MNRKNTHFIQALARGFAVLEAFSREHQRLTLSQLAERTGLNRTAVQRMTDTLVELGYLGRNPYKEFFLGPKVLSLGFAYLRASELSEMAAAYLGEFSERIGKTVNMAVLDDTEIIFLYRHEVKSFLKYDLRAGSKLPSHCTASGKVLLAALSDEELQKRLQRMRFEAMTNRTITDRATLVQNLQATRDLGYGICDRELSPGLYSIGVPLLNHESRVKAAVNLSMSSEEAEAGLKEGFLRELVGIGRKVSAILGYEGAYPIISPGSGEGEGQ